MKAHPAEHAALTEVEMRAAFGHGEYSTAQALIDASHHSIDEFVTLLKKDPEAKAFFLQLERAQEFGYELGHYPALRENMIARLKELGASPQIVDKLADAFSMHVAPEVVAKAITPAVSAANAVMETSNPPKAATITKKSAVKPGSAEAKQAAQAQLHQTAATNRIAAAERQLAASTSKLDSAIESELLHPIPSLRAFLESFQASHGREHEKPADFIKRVFTQDSETPAALTEAIQADKNLIALKNKLGSLHSRIQIQQNHLAAALNAVAPAAAAITADVIPANSSPAPAAAHASEHAAAVEAHAPVSAQQAEVLTEIKSTAASKVPSAAFAEASASGSYSAKMQQTYSITSAPASSVPKVPGATPLADTSAVVPEEVAPAVEAAAPATGKVTRSHVASVGNASAKEEGWLARMGGTIKKYPGRTSAAALATVGLGYVLMHEKRTEAPASQAPQR